MPRNSPKHLLRVLPKSPFCGKGSNDFYQVMPFFRQICENDTFDNSEVRRLRWSIILSINSEIINILKNKNFNRPNVNLSYFKELLSSLRHDIVVQNALFMTSPLK